MNAKKLAEDAWGEDKDECIAALRKIVSKLSMTVVLSDHNNFVMDKKLFNESYALIELYDDEEDKYANGT